MAAVPDQRPSSATQWPVTAASSLSGLLSRQLRYRGSNATRSSLPFVHGTLLQTSKNAITRRHRGDRTCG
jgi:hypothetical protein